MLNARMEKEEKMLLTREQYQNLKAYINGFSQTQVNEYYLAEKKYILRLRHFPDINKYIFTLKIKQEGGHLEYEKEIATPTFVDSYIKEVFTNFNIHNIRYLGQATTIRTSQSNEYGEICLDYSIFGEEEDYELEYELRDANCLNYDALNILLKKANLSFKTNKVSKFARFLKAKENKLIIAIHSETSLNLENLPYTFIHNVTDADKYCLNIFTQECELLNKLLRHKRPCLLINNKPDRFDYNLFYSIDEANAIKKIIEEEILLPH